MKYLLSLMMALLVAGPTQNAMADKVKLTGEQHADQLKKFSVYAGTSPRDYIMMITTQPGGKRELYWSTGEGKSAIWYGRTYVEGDQICDTYDKRPKPQCSEIYRLDDGTFEKWRDGELRLTYRIILEEAP